MFRSIRSFTLALAVVATVAQAQRVSAFSMKGAAITAWQTLSIGYLWNEGIGGGAGPMNLGEEYRLNTPVLYYAFDESFLNYFGQRGIEEVQKAIKIINDLPKMSEIDIDKFPLQSQRQNYRAAALGLLDLKSITLSVLLEQIGLADPTRYVFTIRSRWITPAPQTNYFVIKRNFDPVTWQPSSYINGQLWTYNTIVDNQNAPIAYPVNEPVDPLLMAEPVATGFGWTFSRFTSGVYYTGLTRDDVGGLKYIYRPDNVNAEDVAPGGTPASSFLGLLSIPGVAGSATQWGNIFSTPGINYPPWGALLFTNFTGTNGAGITNTIPSDGTIPAAGTNGFVALRRGIDKITYVRAAYDSLVGQFFVPVTSVYNEEIVTNGVVVGQAVVRTAVSPDLLFTAADLTGTAAGTAAGIGPDTSDRIFTLSRGVNYINNDTLNGYQLLGGPGVIAPPMIITFNKLGPAFFNSWPFFLSEPSNPFAFAWGSFDGTTNPPVVYPSRLSIEELEQQVLGGR